MLQKSGVVRHLSDLTAGNVGMLSVAGEHLHALNPEARPASSGQLPASTMAAKSNSARRHMRVYPGAHPLHDDMAADGIGIGREARR